VWVRARQDAAAAFAVPEDVEDEAVEVDDEEVDDEEVDEDEVDDESLDEVDDSDFLAGESPLVLDFSALPLPERESLR